MAVKSMVQPATAFHMTTQSCATRKQAPEASSSSDSLPLSSSPSSSATAASSQTKGKKRKAAEMRSDSPDEVIEAKRQRPDPEERASGQGEQPTDLDYNKEQQYWPQYNPKKPVYYTSAGTRYRPGSAGGGSETRSPKKSTRGGGRGRGGGHANSGGRKGRQKGKGARGGESPEPPNRRRPLTQDDRVEISMLKARQQELKRFFKVVGAQQIDILDQLASGDLSKIARKPKAHKHVPEHDMATETLEQLMESAQDTITARYRVQVEHEVRRMMQEKEVIERQFKTHVAEARKEHLAGAEGDIILFERAYRAAHDDTHTESGSDMDYFPHYHELPEADRQPRGYVSSKIMDEKPFKQQLASFDEQARQEVLNEDVIRPLLKQMERRNNEWREELIRKKSQNLDALSAEAIKELENIKGYLVPRPFKMGDSGSYALSALADVSEWIAQQQPERQYIYMPLAPGDSFPREALDFSPLPGQAPQVGRPTSSNQNHFQYPANNRLFSTLPPPPAPIPATGPGDRTLPRIVTSAPGDPTLPRILPNGPGETNMTLPRIVSSGPGQPIAPAPPKQPAPRASGPSLFRYSTRMSAQPQQPSPTMTNGPQQFIFQPPQQPYQHQPAPGPLSTPQYGPTGAGAPIGQQTKIPITFVNQTIASRNAAAASAASAGNGNGNANANGKGGQRILLPKV
ncbi:hypothetical protein A1O1_05329 [Capronia coronata CBS 617.96]|uniref:Uncharacterized protein n=1 Tax=Capronia coronata CBS 617.96 TaxID=1182541 RepID=W9Z1M1_9EURO|nr:uncharacterized protein A1O1_05329 [Capronia coronata CBS 617.96]EXJ88399.1 hypothetical protein A1O1_05329 [Capronia coronata CBS 617.96]